MPQTRISTRAHRVLRKLSKETGATSEQILDQALDLFERRRILDDINAGYAALKANSDAWAAEQIDRAMWDETLADGE